MLSWQKLKAWWANFDIKPTVFPTAELLAEAEQLLEQGKYADCETILRRITRCQRRNIQALLLLAKLYRAQNLFGPEEAILKSAIRISPQDTTLKFILSKLYGLHGLDKERAKVFREILQVEPDEPVARHMLAVLEGESLETAQPPYVQAVFNDYAVTFEQHLVQTLQYTGHQACADAASKLKRVESCLDLGCGTGLVGELLQKNFKPQLLVGVDLAEQMLAKAREKKVYHALHEQEILKYLTAEQQNYDFISAADVCIYVGALRRLCGLIYERLHKGGIFACTIEVIDDKFSYKLQPSGRFAHSLAYIRDCADAAGFGKIDCDSLDLRMEYGNIVAGYLVSLQK